MNPICVGFFPQKEPYLSRNLFAKEPYFLSKKDVTFENHLRADFTNDPAGICSRKSNLSLTDTKALLRKSPGHTGLFCAKNPTQIGFVFSKVNSFFDRH